MLIILLQRPDISITHRHSVGVIGGFSRLRSLIERASSSQSKGSFLFAMVAHQFAMVSSFWEGFGEEILNVMLGNGFSFISSGGLAVSRGLY